MAIRHGVEGDMEMMMIVGEQRILQMEKEDKDLTEYAEVYKMEEQEPSWLPSFFPFEKAMIKLFLFIWTESRQGLPTGKQKSKNKEKIFFNMSLITVMNMFILCIFENGSRDRSPTENIQNNGSRYFNKVGLRAFFFTSTPKKTVYTQ
jgi:hypothetical protein